GFLGSLIWVSSGPSSLNGDMNIWFAPTAISVLALLALRGTYILMLSVYFERYRIILNALSSGPPVESRITLIVSSKGGSGKPNRSSQRCWTRHSVDSPRAPIPTIRPVSTRQGAPAVASTKRLPAA